MTEEGWREPFAAARSGDRMTVLRMIDYDRSVLDLRDPSGVTLLHVAAERDDVELLLGLIERGADTRVEAPWGQTAFEWAANLGSNRAAEVLRSRGFARESLWASAALGWLEDVRRILSESGAEGPAARPLRPEVDPRGWPEGTAVRVGDARSDALYIACRNGHLQVAQLLYGAGADIRAKGYFGASALHWAAINGHEEIVRWLIDSGAETELHDPRFESTPGGWARERGHERLALLIEAGSSPAEEES